MRWSLVALLCVAALAGCTAKGSNDPFAYMKKPLYTGGFDLEDIATRDQQEFRVEDGSILQVYAQVWVNATAGGAQVEISDPSGRVVLSTTEHAEQGFPMTLGVWRVKVTPTSEDAAGHVGILVTRR